MTALLIAFAAGVLTTLNPCVLPMLPLLVVGGVSRQPLGPVALAMGMVVSFTLVGVAVAAIGPGLDLDAAVIRQGAAALLLLSGFILVYAPMQAAFARLMAPVAARANLLTDRLMDHGLGRQAALGAVFGAIWSPCVGPTLGAAVAVASQGGNLRHATGTMLVFGTGMASVLLVFAYVWRGAIGVRRSALALAGAGARRLFGWALVMVGTLVVSGGDKILEGVLTRAMPRWLLELTTRL